MPNPDRIRLARNHEIPDIAGIAPPFGGSPYDPLAGAVTTTLEVKCLRHPNGDSTDIKVVAEWPSLPGTLVNCAGGPTRAALGSHAKRRRAASPRATPTRVTFRSPCRCESRRSGQTAQGNGTLPARSSRGRNGAGPAITASSSTTSGGNAGLGQVWQYRPISTDRGQLILVFESPDASILDSPDNIAVSPRGCIVFYEDRCNG